MRRKLLLLALASMLMSLCVPTCAQQQFSIKDDTIKIDTAVYRLSEGQTYEDFIRKLPGVEILEDGTITVNGNKVTRILLNGPDIINKEDTTLKRLTADMISKVKSYDMSEKRIKKDKNTSDCYVIEIGAISDQNRARPAYREEFTKKTYQVPEGISVKELIFSLPGIKTNILGRLVAKKSKKTVRGIDFNSQWVFPQKSSSHLYYTNDTRLIISAPSIDMPVGNYTEDTKLNNGTAFVKIKEESSSRRRHGADIVIEYYQNVSYEMVGGNTDYVDLGLSVKWATRNVGAAGPEEIGGFYSWDEAESKLSGSWRMPTTDEINELIENCTWTWASVNGEIGFLITSNIPGYTDRSIFLPYYYGGTSGEVGYWSGSFNANSDDISGTASLWICFDGYIRSGYCYRTWQLPVRPVCP